MARLIYTYFDTTYSTPQPELQHVQAHVEALVPVPPGWEEATMRVPDSMNDEDAQDRGRTSRLEYERFKRRGKPGL